jgi:succinate dehydrogenase hydrophobic anchor subunit
MAVVTAAAVTAVAVAAVTVAAAVVMAVVTAAVMVVPAAAETPGVTRILNLILVLALNHMEAGYQISLKSKLTTSLDRY